MFTAPRAARFVCCAAVVALLTGCAPDRAGGGGRDVPGPPSSAGSSSGPGPSTTPPTTAGTFSASPASPGDRDQLGDFCGWYTDDLPQGMDTISVFLGTFGVAGGDYSDPQTEGPAQEAAQAAGDAADALNDFLAGFPNDLSEAARHAVLALRDAMTALASAIRDQQGSEQINAEVALFDEAYKALRPACG